MDFMSDALFDGRPFRLLTVVDCCSREGLATVPRATFRAFNVVEVLDRLAAERGKPKTIRVRVRRRIDVKPDDVAQLGDEFRIARQLELSHPMRLETMRAPDALHRGDADPSGLAMAAPVQCVVSPGGSLCVSATTRSATAGGSAQPATGASCRATGHRRLRA